MKHCRETEVDKVMNQSHLIKILNITMKEVNQENAKFQKRLKILWTIIVLLGYASFFLFRKIHVSVIFGLAGTWLVNLIAYKSRNKFQASERRILLLSAITIPLILVMYICVITFT